jgi:hypothetical protein
MTRAFVPALFFEQSISKVGVLMHFATRQATNTA